jgi:glucosamine-6-phosphate deaminase
MRRESALKNVHVFHLDIFLDWQGCPFPFYHPFNFEGWTRKNIYEPIASALGIPEEQRHFPNVNNDLPKFTHPF